MPAGFCRVRLGRRATGDAGLGAPKKAAGGDVDFSYVFVRRHDRSPCWKGIEPLGSGTESFALAVSSVGISGPRSARRRRGGLSCQKVAIRIEDGVHDSAISAHSAEWVEAAERMMCLDGKHRWNSALPTA